MTQVSPYPISFELQNVADFNGDGVADHIRFRQVSAEQVDNEQIVFMTKTQEGAPHVLETVSLANTTRDDLPVVIFGSQSTVTGKPLPSVKIIDDLDGDGALDTVTVFYQGPYGRLSTYTTNFSDPMVPLLYENGQIDHEAYQSALSEVQQVSGISGQKDLTLDDGSTLRTLKFAAPDVGGAISGED